MEESFVTESKKLSLYFHRTDYPADFIQSSFQRAYLQDRTNLIAPTVVNETTTNDNLFLITTHHPTFFEVDKIVSENLTVQAPLAQYCRQKFVRGFCRCKNLQDILVRAKIMPCDNMGQNAPATRGAKDQTAFTVIN